MFTYSAEDGTKAGRMHGQIPAEIKQQRADNIMQIQAELIEDINSEYIGKTYDVLCEGFDEEACMYTGRAYFQAPDIDGRVYFTSVSEIGEGTFVPVEIETAEGYDLFGKATEQTCFS